MRKHDKRDTIFLRAALVPYHRMFCPTPFHLGDLFASIVDVTVWCVFRSTTFHLPSIPVRTTFTLRSHPVRANMMPIPQVQKKGKKSKVCDSLKT